MKTGFFQWLAPLLGVVWLSGVGCTTQYHQVNTVEPAHPSYERRPVQDKRVIRDSDAARAVRVLNVFEGTTPDGLTRVGVEVQNQRGKSFRFNFRFDWFDAQGFPISTPPSSMISQVIEPGQLLVLDAVAPNADAKDFRLTMQKSTRDYFPILPKN